MNDFLKQIADAHGWKTKRLTTVHGGDVSKAFCVETTTGNFFVKLNSIENRPFLFQKEAIGLQALQKHFPLKVPAVIDVGKIGETQYLVLEWLQQTAHTADSQKQFGRALAQLHQATNTHFGWPEESYIASVPQTNEWYDSWPLFYAEKRIMPLVKRLAEKSILNMKEVKDVTYLCSRFADMMPQELPALLHGDLWSGNAMAVIENNQTTTAIYDPNVYYGHRETDIGMTQIFGGFSPLFYDAYQEVFPLEKGWQQRLPLFQLYPLLVHALLFGGGYVDSVREIIKKA